MFSEVFLSQFWPQFWASIAATLFLALIAFVFTYLARLHIVRFLKTTISNIKNTVIVEEEHLKQEYIEKK